MGAAIALGIERAVAFSPAAVERGPKSEYLRELKKGVEKLLQAVREVYEITEGPPGQPGERPLNKVVLIGRGLMPREEELLGGLKGTVA